MFERLIKRAFLAGITELTSEPSRIVGFFMNQHDLTEDEAEKVRDIFLRVPPSVQINYPKKDASFPLYAIVLGDERESHKFIGDSGGMVTVDDIEEQAFGTGVEAGSEVKASVMQHTYNVMVLSENPDVTMYYYELAKYFLIRNLDYFKDNGLVSSHFGGADFKPEDIYLPDFLFGRVLRMSCEVPLIIVDDKVPRAKSVRGIHVDDGSSIDRLGGVRAKVGIMEDSE